MKKPFQIALCKPHVFLCVYNKIIIKFENVYLWFHLSLRQGGPTISFTMLTSPSQLWVIIILSGPKMVMFFQMFCVEFFELVKNGKNII